MKRIVVSLIIGGLLGGFAGFVAGIFVYPYIFLADIVAAEDIGDVSTRQLVAEGAFIHADPGDPIHYGSGGVTVYADAVHLQDDFQVGPGPAFHVYLAPQQEVTPDTDVAASMYVDLGRLRAFMGSQVYKIPAGVDLKRYPNVIVWCQRFGVLISPAKLAFL
ncbi:MAG: DM13 domain-containing protein [Gammaproteobacteria bacterium]|nr:DM13 domain-containing protein [Gammaproteobacteria bacterium]